MKLVIQQQGLHVLEQHEVVGKLGAAIVVHIAFHER